jgi:phosphate:Na+ symporter
VEADVAVGLIGGIGVFLLGMLLLSEGLRALAGGALRRGLARFTSRRLSAVASGAIATSLLQSSTATTMTTIGLVNARLLPVRNAIGVILGANLGTTSTAWIVAYFGLALDISGFALLAIAAGAVMRLTGRDRLASAGLPLAGFGLLFLGIGLMQTSMAGLAERVDLTGSIPSSLLGTLLLVAIGAAMTIVMQSSSAAVATTLAALHGGAIGLDQAAALVIGQNIGTTPKALLASLGASALARRTAMGHVLFNLGTGVVALAILPLFVRAASLLSDIANEGGPDPTIALAVFHTLFNLVGVVLVLPWLDTFTRLVSRLVPERGGPLTRHLDASVASVPPLAVEAVRSALVTCAAEMADATVLLATRSPTTRERRGARLRLQRVREALDQASSFLAGIRSDPGNPAEHARHVAVLHALDHLTVAAETVRSVTPLERFRSARELAELRSSLRGALERLVAWCRGDRRAPADEALDRLAAIPPQRRSARQAVLDAVARGDLDADEAEGTLDALAWAQALSHHLVRALHYLREPGPATEGGRS